MSVAASCPNCGAQVVFNIGDSYVVVCRSCRSVVARGDHKVEDLGKVPDFIASHTRLRVGLQGNFKGASFTLVGRAQLGNKSGGTWDEFYAHFNDGRWGWIAEAQGSIYLTFAAALNTPYPTEQSLVVGGTVQDMQVVEVSEARALTAEGELPFRFAPNATWKFADLSGANHRFGTIDFSDKVPGYFVGEKIALAALGIPERELQSDAAPTEIAAQALQCPHCGGALALRAPGQSLRVTCPSCHALLDIDNGALRYLTTLNAGQAPESLLPLGAKATLFGNEYIVLGYVLRSVHVDHERYPWSEYLLFAPRVGFRWIVEENGHFNFVTPIEAGEVDDLAASATYKGEKFRAFQSGKPIVDYVAGEFYWRVSVGDTVDSRDYVSPPRMLSREKDSAEINWSLSEYVDAAVIKAAYSLAELPPPTGIVANQPKPFADLTLPWIASLVVLFALLAAITATCRNQIVFHQDIIPVASDEIDPNAPNEGTNVLFSEPFDIDARQNIQVAVKAFVHNSWVSVTGDLINEETSEVHPFEIPIEFYSGPDWTEGSTHGDLFLRAPGKGRYTLRLESTWEKRAQPPVINVTLREGVWSGGQFFLALLGISLLPLYAWFRRRTFETVRWEDSTFAGGSS